MPEPQSASDYDDRTTSAVKSALVEIGQVLGSYRGKFAVVGGIVPWLMLESGDMDHVGSIDVDLALDHKALADGEYASLVELLMGHGYAQREDLRKFQLVRKVEVEGGGAPIDVVVDFLMPRDASIIRNNPPIISDFAVQKADGADLAIRYHEMVAVKARMPGGASNRVEIAVCSIPALLAMKGHALNGRLKNKDAYDVYYCVRNFPGGIDALAEECRPVLETESGRAGFGYINAKFDEPGGYGPACVRDFVRDTDILEGRTPEQWQRDAFGQVEALMRTLGLR